MGETTQEEGWVVCRVFKKKNHHKIMDSPNNSSITTDAKVHMLNSSNDGALDQIFQYMGRTCKQENETGNTINTTTTTTNLRYLRPIETSINNGFHERFMQLPALVSPTLPSLPNDSTRLDHIQDCSSQACYSLIDGQVLTDSEASATNHINQVYHNEPGLNDWAALDRLVASHLNGQSENCKQLACFNEPTMGFCSNPDQDLQLPQMRSSNRSFNTSQDYNSEIDLWSFTRSSSSSLDPLCHVSNSSV